MTIETLTYIHAVLRDRVSEAEAFWQAAKAHARELQYSAEEKTALTGVPTGVFEFEKADKEAQELRWKLTQAKKALQDFESHEWR